MKKKIKKKSTKKRTKSKEQNYCKQKIGCTCDVCLDYAYDAYKQTRCGCK